MKRRVLVVGCQPKSVGEAIRTEAEAWGCQTTSAGISGEDVRMNIVDDSMADMIEELQALRPRYVISTVGLNTARPPGDEDQEEWYRWHFETNVTGNMRLLHAYRQALRSERGGWQPGMGYAHFVAISSNSARLPRSPSAAYCASKAALSMAVRCEAREALRGNEGLLAYVYEPGLIRGTGMTASVGADMSGPLTRMQGAAAAGLDAEDFAGLVVRNLEGGPGLSGTRIPYDADEL